MASSPPVRRAHWDNIHSVQCLHVACLNTLLENQNFELLHISNETILF